VPVHPKIHGVLMPDATYTYTHPWYVLVHKISEVSVNNERKCRFRKWEGGTRGQSTTRRLDARFNQRQPSLRARHASSRLHHYTYDIRKFYSLKPGIHYLLINMSPISQLARGLLILHAVVSFTLGVYSFINPPEFSAMTGIECQALQSMGLWIIMTFVILQANNSEASET
jgi:hypothetical protein